MLDEKVWRLWWKSRPNSVVKTAEKADFSTKSVKAVISVLYVKFKRKKKKRKKKKKKYEGYNGKGCEVKKSVKVVMRKDEK